MMLLGMGLGFFSVWPLQLVEGRKASTCLDIVNDLPATSYSASSKTYIGSKEKSKTQATATECRRIGLTKLFQFDPPLSCGETKANR